MYYVNNNLNPLGSAMACPGSIYESLVWYLRHYPDTESLSIYHDCGRFGRTSDFQFVCMLDKKKIQKFLFKMNDDSS